jgi:hypothetical protein
MDGAPENASASTAVVAIAFGIVVAITLLFFLIRVSFKKYAKLFFFLAVLIMQSFLIVVVSASQIFFFFHFLHKKLDQFKNCVEGDGNPRLS